jgi:P-type Ca2+ transporter type 2C
MGATAEAAELGAAPAVPCAWALPAEEVLAQLGVAAGEGLAPAEVATRAARHGANRLHETPPTRAWVILVRQLEGLVTYLLAAAALAGFLFREWEEGVAILAVLLLNAGIGFATEWRAVRSMEALRRLGSTLCRVRRAASVREVPADSLVPGDVVLLEAGDVVPADLRLLAASRLQAAEAELTGESLPVDKGVEPVAEEAPLAERTDLLFRGTAVVRGSGEGVVVATGMATEVGRIASLVAAVGQEKTPLEVRLDHLGRTLAWVALAIAAATAVAGILAGRGVFLMIETGIALAVAAIPEGLPIVATLALARGVYRMAKNNALVNRLAAVETLGAVTVLCTDKTGTLTENRMTLTRLAIDGQEVTIAGGAAGLPAGSFAERAARVALAAGVLCANAELAPPGSGQGEGIGDPLELALLAAGRRLGLERRDLLAEFPEVREEAFDSSSKRMATVHRCPGGGFRVVVKGAPEEVLAACSAVFSATGPWPLDGAARQRWAAANERLAGQGYRMLALAEKTEKDAPGSDEPLYRDLTLLALAAVQDPPRAGIGEAVASCRAAGIEAVLVTGDQEPTARAVALAVGLVDSPEAPAVSGRDLVRGLPADPAARQRLRAARIFARVDPGQKLDLIALHQEVGGVVAMTGDGVNDAPALRRADIGIAMGRRGSQVAREAADVVLKNDSFATIVFAVRQGRVIFDNIRRFVLYLLGCNLSELLVVASAGAIAAPLPILPLQLLFLNLVTDVFPALALGMGEGDAGVMARPPRPPEEPFLTARHWRRVVGDGALLAAAVWGALWLALAHLRVGGERAVTITFLTLAAAQLWHVFDLRPRGSRLLDNDIVRNPYIWGALALCAGLLVLAVYFRPFAALLKLQDPGLLGWMVVVTMSLAPLVAGQVARAILWWWAPRIES